jgi:hypothetical protein
MTLPPLSESISRAAKLIIDYRSMENASHKIEIECLRNPNNFLYYRLSFPTLAILLLLPLSPVKQLPPRIKPADCLRPEIVVFNV